MRRFIDSVPDKEFAEALEHAPDPKFQTFLAARADPAYRGLSFAALCRKFNISLADVDDLWRSHQLHVGMIEMMNHVPRVMIDIVEDAKSHQGTCTRCDGSGTITRDSDIGSGSAEAPRSRGSGSGEERGRVREARPTERVEGLARITCPVCDGTKKVRVIGDKAARDLVFESIGLTGKRPPGVAIQQNNYGLDAELSEVLMMSQKILAESTSSSGDRRGGVS